MSTELLQNKVRVSSSHGYFLFHATSGYVILPGFHGHSTKRLF